MTGWRTERKPNGVRIYKEGKELFVDQDECNKLAKTIWHAQREYWKEEKRR